MARFNLSDGDRLKLAESLQAAAVAAGTPAEPLHDLTKLRWRGGALDFSKSEQIEPPPDPSHDHEEANAPEPDSKAEIEQTKPLSSVVVPEPAAFVINWRLWGTGIALLLICIAGLTIAVRPGNRSAVRSLHLVLSDHDGQLEIRWDPSSELFRRTVDAKLLIVDGAERLIVTLNPAQLRRGTAIYERRSGHVEVRMTVPETGGKIAQETAMFQSGHVPDPVRTTLTVSSTPQPAVAPQSTVMTPVRQPQAIVPAPAQARTIALIAQPPGTKRLKTAPAEHVSARTGLVQSGTSLPFTCSAGDIFHKSDAPPGWDTFTCRAKNLWSIVKTPRTGESSASKQ
jgi:hypothetical protein